SCLDACELDAGLGVKQLAADQLREEIEMPPGAAEFAVRCKLQAGRGLLVHDLLDLNVLDLAQLFGRDLAPLPLGTRLLDPLWPQQAADLIGTEGRSCSLHGLAPRNSSLARLPPDRDSVRARPDRPATRAWRILRDPISQHGSSTLSKPLVFRNPENANKPILAVSRQTADRRAIQLQGFDEPQMTFRLLQFALLIASAVLACSLAGCGTINRNLADS